MLLLASKSQFSKWYVPGELVDLKIDLYLLPPGAPNQLLGPRTTGLSAAMHTRGQEECGTNVASESSLAVWMSSGLCIFPQITITYTKRVTGDLCVH